MTIEFVNKRGIAGFDIEQGGNLIAFVRYGRVYGYVIDFGNDVSLDIEELEQILSKMKELQSEVK